MAYTNIDDPSAHFHTQLYTGTGANQDVVNDAHSGDFKPDFLWIKNRGNGSYGSHYYDSNRGVKRYLHSDQFYGDDPEGYNPAGNSSVQLFNTNGFRGGSSTNIYEILWETGLNNSYVAWQWKANGGTTTSKSSTTIDTNVTTPCVQQVNTDAGFSIITYTASSSYAGTETHLEHGLGVGPKVLFVKRRDTAADWAVYHAENGASPNAGYGYLVLNTNAATATSSTYWLNTPAESNATLLAFGNNTSVGANGGEYVCYAFAEKQGYSKFGSYIGNGSTDGPFVYTGFKPAFVMMKRTDSTGNWVMFDTKRDTHNVTKHRLFPNLTNADNTTRNYIDLLSNGFKMRDTDVDHNASGATIIYMAFAENPFVTSTGIPTTAR